MSEQNVQRTLDGWAAFERGDIEAPIADWEENVVWKQIEEPSPVPGRKEARAALARWDEAHSTG